MRKEVNVCDVTENNAACPRLADYVCPICRRDVCRQHRVTKLAVHIQLEWPNRPSSNGNPAKDEYAGAQTLRIDVCQECYYDTLRTIVPSVRDLVKTTGAEAVVAYGADLAAARLERDKQG